MMQMHDWSLTVAPEVTTASPLDMSLRFQLRIEKFRYRVSQALALDSSNADGHLLTRERLALYTLLNASLAELEREIQGPSCKSFMLC